MSLSAQSLQESNLRTSGDVIGDSRIENKFSLFDLSRLEMHHSYSISYFSSSGTGTTIGMYINSIRYKISDPLTLNVSLAWMHQPGNLLFKDRGTPTDYGSIFPSFSLEYRPSDKFHFQVEYLSLPAYPYSGNYRYRSMDYWDRYFRQ